MTWGAADTPPFWFYRLAPDAPRAAVERPPGLDLEIWRPGFTSIRPAGLVGMRWLIWWTMHHLRLFGNRHYAVLVARDGNGEVVHRATVFPPFIRFPFMGPTELQIGDVETVPAWRRRGVGSWSLATITGTIGSGLTCWYLTEPSNEASRRTAERGGFTYFGRGRRVPRLGVQALAQFVLDEPQMTDHERR